MTAAQTPAKSPQGEMRFDGRVAVITGAGRGLGRAYALLLAERGCKVVVNDLGGPIRGGESTADDSVAQQVVDEIVAAGGEAIANGDSVATPEGGRAIIGAALDAWGRIDILIHNAGNVRYGSIRELSGEDLHAVLDVHLLGAFHVVQAAFGPMCDAGYGRIILTSSVGGLYGNENCVNYGMSKSAMLGLSNIAALEGEAHGVTSNLIVPGAVTRMAEGLDISQYPPMHPEMVAPVVGWLAHESCTVTGEAIASMAGRVARMFMAETRGIYRPEWTIEQVAADSDAIHDKGADNPKVLDLGLHGHVDHIGYSFAMAKGG